ncbi:hypothetical protein AGOR_G00057150 [Albula goreensis]|uniref:RING-type domain-containing protein n=1 Tax=Albula goreensis TaxID=1534307 RepID=A0A8T3DW28_9TELE|nr:hypothetical protein AGOR_G00057150 [Albula goreensis]
MSQKPEKPQSLPPPDEGAADAEAPDLECAICFSQFNNVFRTPKMLQCRHTFCLECLARMNVKSPAPEAIQCPLCRGVTPLPSLGLPKLDNNPTILSYLPEAMQRVYSVRFNRSKGRLQVKRPRGHLPEPPAPSATPWTWDSRSPATPPAPPSTVAFSSSSPTSPPAAHSSWLPWHFCSCCSLAS